MRGGAIKDWVYLSLGLSTSFTEFICLLERLICRTGEVSCINLKTCSPEVNYLVCRPNKQAIKELQISTGSASTLKIGNWVKVAEKWKSI